MSSHQSPFRFFSIWLSLGLQSFGGGVATFALIRDAAVNQHAWISEEEFTHEWAMVLLVPGINLLALTILIGRRARGAPGVVMALVGLMLPSVIMTALITAAYTHIRALRQVQAALKGVVPAIVALGLFTSAQMAQPILKAAYKEGRFSLTLSLVVVVASGLLVACSRVPVVTILLACGLLCGSFQWISARARATPEPIAG